MNVSVNNVAITEDEIHREMQYHPAGSLEEARYLATQALITRQLLLQEAVRQKLVTIDETKEANQATALNDKVVEAAVDRLLQQEVSVPEADTESCARYYQQNQARFVDKKTAELLPLEAVTRMIRDYLHTRSLQTGISHYIDMLYEKARIVGFER